MPLPTLERNFGIVAITSAAYARQRSALHAAILDHRAVGTGEAHFYPAPGGVIPNFRRQITMVRIMRRLAFSVARDDRRRAFVFDAYSVDAAGDRVDHSCRP